MTKLWSYRFSFARGWHWVYERDCYENNSQEWLDCFQKDNPSVMFKLSVRKPKNLLTTQSVLI